MTFPAAGARELLQAAALSALLFALGALLPLFGPVAGFFASVPLILVGARRGLPVALGAAAVAAAALAAAGMPPAVLLLYAGEHGLPAAWLGGYLGRGGRVFRGAAAAALVVALAGAAAVAAWTHGAQTSPTQVIEAQLTEAVRAVGGDGAGALPTQEEISSVVAALWSLAPALALTGLFLEFGLNALLAARLLLRSGHPGIRPPDLVGFRLPDRLVWVFIASLALSLAPHPAAVAGRNAAVPLAVLYLVQGLAVSLALSVRVRLSRLGSMLIAAALVLQPYLLAIPFTLGVLDFRFDFRRRWAARPPGPGGAA